MQHIYEVAYEGTRSFSDDSNPQSFSYTMRRYVLAATAEEAIIKFKALYTNDSFSFAPEALESVTKIVKNVVI